MKRFFHVRVPLVFVDKFCIDQQNADRKIAAIHRLGGLLHHSRRLVILWTPQYFERLWCTFEIASWLKLGKPMSATVFCPLKKALACLTLLLYMNTVAIVHAICR